MLRNCILRVCAALALLFPAAAMGEGPTLPHAILFVTQVPIPGDFTTIGSTGPDSGSRYIVDAFLVVVSGGTASLLGCLASAFGIAQAQSVLEFFLDGTKGKVATLLVIVVALMIRPQGLFPGKVRGH